MTIKTLASALRLVLSNRKPAIIFLASLCTPTPALPAALPVAFFGRRPPLFSRSLNKMAKLDSPSAQRNKEPIWNVLATKVLPDLPKRGKQDDDHEPIKVLEIAAGCGVHSHYFSLQMMSSNSNFQWYPSDPEESSRASIQAYLDDEIALKGMLQPPIDIALTENGAVNETPIQGIRFNLMLCINMIHISPWTATLGLMKVASNNLVQGGILYLYGPYKVNGQAVESNLRFDQSLQSRDPSWGVRNLEDVLEAAKEQGLVHVETIEMPANNLSVILQKKS